MVEYRANVERFMLASAVLTIIGVSAYVIYSRKDVSLALEILIEYGAIISLPSIMWWLFNNILWKVEFINKFLKSYFNLPPNLNGRWVGKLTRINDESQHDFILEIKQTMTEIVIKSYSKNSFSQSIINDFSTDRMKDDFNLCFLWEGCTDNAMINCHNSGKFQGYTILNFIDNSHKKLIGHYFTNRKPEQTQGKVSLEFESYKLLGEF